MSCPECGRPEIWSGMSWTPHAQEAHDRARRRLCGTIGRQLGRYLNLRVREAEAHAQGLVVIHTVSEVYRGLGLTSTVTRTFWEELGGPEAFMRMDRAWLLRHLREDATEMAKAQYGVDVNPATWRQRVVGQA